MASSHYAILGVPRAFTNDQLKRQYRLLALRWHPDRNRGAEEAAAEKFKAIHLAWSTLSDPEERRIYDGDLNERETARERPSPSRHKAARSEEQRRCRRAGCGDEGGGGGSWRQGAQSRFESAWQERRAHETYEQRAGAQREERRGQYQAARNRAEQAYWREFTSGDDGIWGQAPGQAQTPAQQQAQPARARPPEGLPPTTSRSRPKPAQPPPPPPQPARPWDGHFNRGSFAQPASHAGSSSSGSGSGSSSGSGAGSNTDDGHDPGHGHNEGDGVEDEV